MLPLDKEIHRIEEPAYTYRHVVIQEVGGLRYLQIDRCRLVLEFQLHLTFEEKPVGELPEKKRIECRVEKWILTAACRKSGSSVTSKKKFRCPRECFFHLRLQRVHFLSQFIHGLR